ncbi:MAG: histidine phosphatase family protein [Candidatus Paceibacterota bacterium]
MKIFFIRHGETTGDVENLYGGDYDDHLSEKGEKQSLDLARNLSNKGIEIIYSSPLIRAQETSKALSDKLGCEIITIPDLKERNQYGILTGMNKDEAKQKYPKEVELLKDKLNTIEKAESYEDFSKRLMDAFNEITNSSKYEIIAIVAHGGPFRVLFRDILKWGEISDLGDCAYVELERTDNEFKWIHSEGFNRNFQIPSFN